MIAGVPVTLFLDYEGADDLLGDFAQNLSTGGTFVATDRDLPMNTPVQLMLSFPGLIEPIAIEGTVLWSRPSGADGDRGVGIELTRGAARDELAVLIDRIRNRDSKMISRLFRVLIVDDNHHVATLIQGGLASAIRREFGDGVSLVFRSAEDGRTALEILGRETIDALIIDVYLPILNGPQVIAQARNQLGLSTLPIIAVSAGGDDARRAALEAGANVFLDKPMRLRQVFDAIQRLLRVELPRKETGDTP